jgi:hypothetical protein
MPATLGGAGSTADTPRPCRTPPLGVDGGGSFTPRVVPEPRAPCLSDRQHRTTRPEIGSSALPGCRGEEDKEADPASAPSNLTIEPLALLRIGCLAQGLTERADLRGDPLLDESFRSDELSHGISIAPQGSASDSDRQFGVGQNR